MLSRLVAAALVAVLAFVGIAAGITPAAGEEATVLTPPPPAEDRTATAGYLYAPLPSTPGIATGGPTGGRMHTIKGQETLRGLTNWLRRNPDAGYYDRLVAQSLIDELSAVLRGAS